MLAQVCLELAQRILPGMMLMTPDAFLANEAWSLLQLLPYTIRYEVYDAVTVSHLLAAMFVSKHVHVHLT